MKRRKSAPPILVALLTIICPILCLAQGTSPAPEPLSPPFYGPWNAVILPGGDGLHAALNGNDTILRAESPWTLLLWVNAQDAIAGRELIAGVGAPNSEYPRYLAIAPGKVVLYLGRNEGLEGPAVIAPGKWHMLAATFDGRQFRLFADGVQVAEGTLRQLGKPATATTELLVGTAEPTLEIAPAQATGWEHFGGKIAGLELLREAISPDVVQQMADHPLNFDLPVYEEGSKTMARADARTGRVPRATGPSDDATQQSAIFASPITTAGQGSGD